MIHFFDSLSNVISSLVNFLINSVQSLFYLLTHIPDYINFIVSSINILPTTIIPFILASIYIFVILLILGRDH